MLPLATILLPFVETFPGTLAIIKNFKGYHYGDLLRSQLSFQAFNKLLSQHSLMDLHVSILEELRKKSPYPDKIPHAICEDVPSMEMMHHEPVPHHDNSSDGEPSPVISRELASGLDRDPLPLHQVPLQAMRNALFGWPSIFIPIIGHLANQTYTHSTSCLLRTSWEPSPPVMLSPHEMIFSSSKSNGEFCYQHA